MSCKLARLTAHPYANFLPLLEGEPFDKLVAGVKANDRQRGQGHSVSMNTLEALDTIERVDTAAPIAVEVDDAPADAASTPTARGVALHDLKPNSCLYAIAEPAPRFHLFCAAPVSAFGSPGCAENQQLCYATIPAPQRPYDGRGAASSRIDCVTNINTDRPARG